MPYFKIKAIAHLPVVLEIEAENEEKAQEMAGEVAENCEADICVHGSELSGGINPESFVLVDGVADKIEVIEIELQDYNT